MVAEIELLKVQKITFRLQKEDHVYFPFLMIYLAIIVGWYIYRLRIRTTKPSFLILKMKWRSLPDNRIFSFESIIMSKQRYWLLLVLTLLWTLVFPSVIAYAFSNHSTGREYPAEKAEWRAKCKAATARFHPYPNKGRACALQGFKWERSVWADRRGRALEEEIRCASTFYYFVKELCQLWRLATLILSDCEQESEQDRSKLAENLSSLCTSIIKVCMIILFLEVILYCAWYRFAKLHDQTLTLLFYR